MSAVTGRRKVRFAIVDVFSDEPLAGNPLAVVDDADSLSVEQMRQLAMEFNQAQTTFLLSPTAEGADVRLRSFTATGAEVFGPGHHALGAWWYLAEKGALGSLSDVIELHQEIGAKVLSLTILSRYAAPQSIEMRQSAPEFGPKILDLGVLAEALGVDEHEFACADLPAQIVSTGIPHLMVAMKGRDAVDRIEPHASALRELLIRHGGQGCYVYSLDPTVAGALAYARFFNPVVGVREDSATGTAAGPLVCHLVAHGLAPGGSEVVIEQGRRMGRPSLIRIHVDGDDVRLRGACFTSATGEIYVDQA